MHLGLSGYQYTADCYHMHIRFGVNTQKLFQYWLPLPSMSITIKKPNFIPMPDTESSNMQYSKTISNTKHANIQCWLCHSSLLSNNVWYKAFQYPIFIDKDPILKLSILNTMSMLNTFSIKFQRLTLIHDSKHHYPTNLLYLVSTNLQYHCFNFKFKKNTELHNIRYQEI